MQKLHYCFNITLVKANQPQPPPPIITYNSAAAGCVDDNIQIKKFGYESALVEGK